MNAKWCRHKLDMISFLGALLLAIVFATPSFAHWADLAVAEIVIGKTQTQITLTIPTGLIALADDNHDSQLSEVEFHTHQAELKDFLGDNLRLTDGKGNRGALTIKPSETAILPLTIQGNASSHSTLLLTYTWSLPTPGLTINYDLFLPGVSTARCLATILQAGESQTFVFTPENRRFSLIHDSVWQQTWSFMLLGIEHILTGYDHIVFLLSLLIMGNGLSYLFKVVTAFTLSHSVALALAVLNIVTLPVRLVESAIALTIIYVASENLWQKNLQWRWLLTFCFGLIHGLGFAGILKGINIPQSNLALSLVSFNVGVEIGQVVIVASAFFLLRNLHRYSWELTFRRLVSACIIAVGLFWFVQRAFLG